MLEQLCSGAPGFLVLDVLFAGVWSYFYAVAFINDFRNRKSQKLNKKYLMMPHGLNINLRLFTLVIGKSNDISIWIKADVMCKNHNTVT